MSIADSMQQQAEEFRGATRRSGSKSVASSSGMTRLSMVC